MHNSQNKNWHALYVRSRTEKTVRDLLIKKGIEVYLPLLKTMRQWSDRKKLIELPLFTGYVFVKTSVAENDLVLRTNGVVGYVKYLGKNALVQDAEIEGIKQLISLGYHLETGHFNRRVHIGEKVKITSGPLKGIEGYVLNFTSADWLEIALESMGQVIKVKLPEGIIKTI